MTGPSSTPSCAVCGGERRVRFDAVVDPSSRETFTIEACVRCGLGHTQPVPADVGAYYGTEYHGGRHGVTLAYSNFRRLSYLRLAGARPGKLLDVGCGDGAFLEAAARKGYAGYGTDLNPVEARTKGLTVETSLDEVRGHGPFSVITSWHSLEHFTDPLRALRDFFAVLAPGGVVVIAVPNADGVQARLFGKRWFHLDVPRHLFHFGEQSLGTAIDAAGGRVVKTWHHELEYDVFGIVQSGLNGVIDTPNALFEMLTGKPTKAGAAERGVSLALGALLGPAAVAGVALTTAMRSGGTLVVSAQRR